MTWNDYHKTMLALTGWREARAEGRDGIRAVMHVIRNRVNAGMGDWDHVITSKWQFSSLTAPGDSQLVLWPDSTNAVFEDCMALAEGVFCGTDIDNTRGALYYANLLHIDKGDWFGREILSKPDAHPLLVKIGRHSFFA